MMLIKKISLSFTALCLFVFGSFSVIYAEEDFGSNPDYYSQMCGKPDLSESEKAICKEYAQYMSDQSGELREQLEEIEANRESIAADIQNQAAKITAYDTEIAVLNEEIIALNVEIDTLQVQIDEKAVEVDAKELQKTELIEKVKDRMISTQGTMRLNQQLDFLMGAESFTDLIRRINGLSDLMDYDDYVHHELLDIIDYLNIAKAELEVSQADVKIKRTEVEEKQNVIALKKAEAELIKEEWLKQEAEWLAQGNQIISNLDSIKDEIAKLSDAIGSIPASSGFIKPVNTGRISANTWSYPTGGTHLGLDIAAPVGTPIYAVANGIVVTSVDGCGTYGGLGNSCGAAQGGTSGGGNQIIMLSRIDGTLYAIKYLHLQQGTLVPKYSEVLQGDQIAGMGSSGNSSGVHLHIEVYKLGNYSINDYIAQWNGDLSFGCGWGTSALNRICSVSGAPCRARPEEIFGY